MTDELPYAPRRKRPLSLWNPLDYLVLLYWVFFFPQAIRWYLEKFGSVPWHTNLREAFRSDRVHRNLLVQMFFLVGSIGAVLSRIIVIFGGSLAWLGIGIAVTLAFVLTGFSVGISNVLAFDLPLAIGCLLVPLFVGIAIDGDGILVLDGLALSSVLMGLVGPVIAIVLGLVFNLPDRVYNDMVDSLTEAVRSAVLGVVVLSAAGIWFGLQHPIGPNSAFVAAMILGSAAVFGITALRLELVALAFLPAYFQRSKRVALSIQRTSPVPIPGLAARLYDQLQDCWEGGIRDCEGLLRYTCQFIPVALAIRRALGSEGSPLLCRVAAWCDSGLRDWDVMRYQSASLRAGVMKAFWAEFILLPSRWRPQIDNAVRYDTPVRAACAGFWHLHEAEPDQARQAFAQVRDLPFGDEMHANCAALAAALGCQTFDEIGDWLPPEYQNPESLRPWAVGTFQRLGQIARDAHLVVHSRSTRERNSALNQVMGALIDLRETLSACPRLEWPLFDKVVWQWIDLVLGVAKDVGSLEAREPVASPYIVGAPVPPARLVGREAVFDQLRSAWSKPGQRDSLLIYGHRRMGKTSVLRNVLAFCGLGADTGLAFLNLQTVDWRGSEPLADLCHAMAFALWRAAPPETPVPAALIEPVPDTFETNPLAELRCFLARLEDATPTRRYILVLDEYELLDACLPAEAGTRFVELLRGLTQQHTWLVVALVGLHDLKERSRSFYEAIFAWRSVRVSFLDAAGVADCLQVEDDAFPLAYSPAALARVLDLTGGQPFLVQMIGDALVQGFNRRLRESIRPPSPTFEAADVDAVAATGDLYEQGAVYFRGIWQQAADGPAGQQAVLKALAAHTKGLDRPGLALAWLPDGDLDTAIQTLVDHDVVTLDGERWRYTVELMRRWVAAGRME